ncbi:MAG: alanine racemase, partial [Clostridia bacterium]|nr:alanine racemase [Clostridia bacterium]
MRALVVDLDALRENIRAIKEAVAVPIYGVCKGNGLGMGLLPFARALQQEGIDRYAVAAIWDAEALRAGGIGGEILMLSSTTLPEEARQIVALGLTGAVGSVAAVETLEQAAAEAGRIQPVHIKLDTGFGRFGFLPGEE